MAGTGCIPRPLGINTGTSDAQSSRPCTLAWRDVRLANRADHPNLRIGQEMKGRRPISGFLGSGLRPEMKSPLAADPTPVTELLVLVWGTVSRGFWPDRTSLVPVGAYG